MGSYRWTFTTITLSRIVAEILYVKQLTKHIPIGNALIPIGVVRAKLGVTELCKLVHIAAPYARHLSD